MTTVPYFYAGEIVPWTKCTIRTCLGQLKLKLSYLLPARSNSISNFADIVKRSDESLGYNCPKLPIPEPAETFEDFQSRQGVD